MVLASVLVVSVTCLIVTAIIGDVPSFEEPLAVSIYAQYLPQREREREREGGREGGRERER